MINDLMLYLLYIKGYIHFALLELRLIDVYAQLISLCLDHNNIIQIARYDKASPILIFISKKYKILLNLGYQKGDILALPSNSSTYIDLFVLHDYHCKLQNLGFINTEILIIIKNRTLNANNSLLDAN